MRNQIFAGFAVTALALFSAGVTRAQQDDQSYPPPQQQQQDQSQQSNIPANPPSPTSANTDSGVGRISLIQGAVSTQRADSGDWSAAAINQPLVAGDKISTGD